MAIRIHDDDVRGELTRQALELIGDITGDGMDDQARPGPRRDRPAEGLWLGAD
jgi:hypothetical protein